MHFLNCAKVSYDQVTNVEIINFELTPEYNGQKGARLDVKAKTQKGEIINIEVQRQPDKDMVARDLFYWGKMFTGQISSGNNYNQLKKTITINVLDFELFKDNRCWRKCHLTDDETNERITELLEMQFVELNKLQGINKDDPMTFWIEFFRDPYSDTVRKLCDYVPEIREAKNIYEKAKTDPKMRELIDAREKAIHDYSNDISCARRDGFAEGELKKAQIMALKMLKKGNSIEDIADLTELSVEEIESLKDKQQQQHLTNKYFRRKL
jgi:predicted transposase/invertase (TIGR01784 family)